MLTRGIRSAAIAAGVALSVPASAQLPKMLRDDAPNVGDTAKLRAEGSRELMQQGDGKLYLRFMMDPLYKVHWNNLSPPIKVRIAAPAGVEVSPSMLEGPDVEAEADIDPREFLVDVAGARRGDVIRLDAFYYACHETEGWCRPIEQSYTVRIMRDHDGGTVFPPNMRPQMERMRNRGRRGR